MPRIFKCLLFFSDCYCSDWRDERECSFFLLLWLPQWDYLLIWIEKDFWRLRDLNPQPSDLIHYELDHRTMVNCHNWWISTFYISFYRLNPLSLALYLFIVWGPIYHFSKKEQNMIPSLWKQQDARFISLSGFYLHTHYPIYQVWNIVKLFYASLKDQTYLFLNMGISKTMLAFASFCCINRLRVHMRVCVNWKIFYWTCNTHSHARQSKQRKEANNNPA